MADSSFNGFIQSVYGSGTAMEYFDSPVNSISAGAIIDDISVESIFGSGIDPSASDYDSDSDKESNHSDSEDDEQEEPIIAEVSFSISGFSRGKKDDSEDDMTNDIVIDLSSLTKKDTSSKTKGGLTAKDVSMLLKPYK